MGTDRGRRSDDAAARTEAFLKTLEGPILEAADSAQMGIAVSVVDQGVVRRIFVSKVAAQILGYSAAELVDKETFLSFPPEEKKRMADLNQRWLRGEAVPKFLETVVLGKDGALIPVEVAYSSVTLDGLPATISFLRDITERKRTEESLKRSEGLFRKLIEAAPEAVGVTRDNLTLVYANPRYFELIGYDTLEEVQKVGVLALIHPDDRDHIPARRRDIDSSPMSPREYRLLRKDGAVLSVECSTLRIEFEGAPALLTFMRDITERKEMQAQLIHTDRMATIGTMAAAVGHELNNPLAYMLINLSQFERELEGLISAPEDRDRVRERLRILHEGASHMASVIRDLRGFCRPNSPALPIDPREVLESAINMALNEITPRARLIRDFEPVASLVLADGARLGQVFLNLLLNAAQSFPTDHNNDDDKERDYTREIRVALSADTNLKRVRIAVSDSGSGIAPADLGRIFEPFFTTKPVGIGSGLGLSICKTIVTDMNGQLTVDSCVGRGSTFTVVLPTADPPHPHANSESANLRGRSEF